RGPPLRRPQQPLQAGEPRDVRRGERTRRAHGVRVLPPVHRLLGLPRAHEHAGARRACLRSESRRLVLRQIHRLAQETRRRLQRARWRPCPRLAMVRRSVMPRQRYTGKTVLEAARERIAFVFDTFEQVIVSVSGGKDSTALAHLVLVEAKRRGRKVGLYFLDEEVVYESTVKQVEIGRAHV